MYLQEQKLFNESNSRLLPGTGLNRYKQLLGEGKIAQSQNNRTELMEFEMIAKTFMGLEEVLASAYRDWETDRKSTRLNSSHITRSRMPSSA